MSVILTSQPRLLPKYISYVSKYITNWSKLTEFPIEAYSSILNHLHDVYMLTPWDLNMITKLSKLVVSENITKTQAMKKIIEDSFLSLLLTGISIFFYVIDAHFS